MEKKTSYTKPLIILALIALLLIPQASIMSLIKDRVVWHTDALEKVRASWPSEQTLAGPFLTLPYTVTDSQQNTHNGTLYLLPDQLNVDANLDSSLIHKGVHKIPVYTTKLAIQGFFSHNELDKIINEYANKTVSWGDGILSYHITDQRGIKNQSTFSWGDTQLATQPGNIFIAESTGLHATLPHALIDQDVNMDFVLNIEVKGMQSLKLAQVAQNSSIRLSSNWLYPDFFGSLLPESQQRTNEGFSAAWESSAYSNNARSALSNCTTDDCSLLLNNNTVGVNLQKPINNYRLSERSVKYAQVFIILSFVTLLLFELFKKLNIHPIQYTLVGLELTVFYLLLISLSEHLSFGWAYMIATLASTLLLTLYLSGILNSLKQAQLFGTTLVALYAILYGILKSEDHALLMGSLLIFLVLALFMLLTRHIDWYTLTENWSTKPVIVDDNLAIDTPQEMNTEDSN